MIYVESTLEPSDNDTFDAGKDRGINADLMRLIKSAAGGEFDPGMMPPGLDGSGLTEVLTKIADTRLAIDLNPLPMITVDADLNFIELNNAALELFGWDREEALGLNVKALDILELKGDSVAVTVREKRLTSAELKFRCPKGILILKEWAAPLLDAAGNARGAHMELIDITREKKAAADIAAWYESILDAVQFPIAVTDLDMNWTLVNTAAEKLIGRKRAEILGKPCSTWNTPICNTGNCAISCLRRGESQTFFEKSGGRFQVDTFYVKDADGEPMGYVEIIEEVTGQARISEYMDTEVNRLGENLERLARGDLNFDLAVAEADEYTQELREDFLKITGNLAKVKEAIGVVISDTERLTRGAAAGKLDARADLARHQGGYRAILEGINDVLDAITDPIQVTAAYIDRIGSGEIPEKITADYRGDFNKIKESLNRCIDGLAGLAEASHALQRMSINDHTIRMNGQYKGIFAEVATSVNDVQDRVNHVADIVERISHGNLSDHAALVKAGKRSDQDRLVPAFVRTLETLQALIKDTETLTRAARKGELSVRADAGKHEGEYRTIVEGINETLDAIADPIEMAATNIARVGRGEIPEKITTEYHGDFNKIKQSLNQCIDGLAGLAEASHALQRMAINDHSMRMTGRYQGIFAEVAASVNDVQDRVNHVADIVERISHGDLSDHAALAKAGKRSEQDRLVPAFVRTLETLQTVIADTEMLTRAARKGELGVRADAGKHEGEYRTIVEGINETLDTVVVPFKKVQGAIVQLESSTQDTSKSSDEIAKATEQVAVTSQRCADLAKQVLEQIQGVEGQMADLSASNEEIAGTAQEVLGATNETAEKGRESLELGEATKRKMAAVEKISQQSVDEITRLNDQMEQIGKIVKLINDIANQTNLLALNAAIEAARAGEHGRGFAVVAGEIRNLAGESKNASHNIEDLITSILANSNQTAKNMEQVYSEIEEGVESVNRTIAELKKIVTGAEHISGDMGEIARAIENQANVANRVVEAMGEGTRLTKETQAQVENLASLSEETSASTEEIGSAAHELNSMAGDLKATMQRFSF